LDAKSIYIFFDLKKQATQTAYNIAASLLKQLALPANKDRTFHQIIYENIRFGERPTREMIIDLFIQCAQSLKVRVLFDALDECKDSELGKAYQLIQKLCDAHVGVYITTRPNIIGHLTERFSDAILIPDIQATEEDIHSFLKRRITENREIVGKDFEAELSIA
jgi:hypothetical protein